jgi:tetratricopeptide (TPR) repeat protein
MKVVLTFIALLLSVAVGAQSRPAVVSPPGKWAIVVGISSYQNPVLSLQYADRDAKAFSDYLKTPAGGNVPASHILLLLNENATYPAIYNALDSLQEVCQKDDIVYFYFSGHGDIESSSIYKLGFLLAYNTPRTNYINNAVRIEDLNIFANTLSVKNQAKVILITDACHSGKLAGSDFRASTLIGEQLRAVQKSEIRITSCAPDQLSAEDAGWGGGRGAFSYYLLNGLNGYADLDHDKVVTLREIGQFLDSALTADQLLQQRAMKQTPVVTGKDDFRLSVVTSTAAPIVSSGNALQLSAAAPMPATLPTQPQTFFFNLLNGRPVEKVFDFARLDQLAADALPAAMVQMMIDSVNFGSAAFTDLVSNSSSPSAYVPNLTLLKSSFQSNPFAQRRFCSAITSLLDRRGDSVIASYLEGDAAEMARRSYYSSFADDYSVYPHMFSVAAKLTPPDAFMRKVLDIKAQYFGGVSLRLKIPTVNDPRKLIDSAMAYQQRAVALEPNAAYIHNELGVLYTYRKNWTAAEKEFKLATLIAPKWAIPWANLAGIYSLEKSRWPKADTALQESMRLQGDYQGAWMSAGLLSQQRGLLLTAEEQFLKSIWINSRHYLPFEKLADIYLRTTQFALADSFYYEADIRKKGFHFFDRFFSQTMVAAPMPMTPYIPCNLDSADIGPTDVMGNFVLGIRALNYLDSGWAEKRFKQVIQLDRNNPLAFHYLGKILYGQKRWKEAALIFNFALQNRLEQDFFNRYCDSLASRLPASKSKSCIDAEYRHYFYEPVEDDYLAGRLYEQWNHFEEAETFYRALIRKLPKQINGYHLLWSMQEKIDRFDDAEKTVREFWSQNPLGENELHSFYIRAMRRYPADAGWHYKAGRFLYWVFADNPGRFEFDRKKIEPDTHRERYLVYFSDPTEPQMSPAPSPGAILLPGIDEFVFYAAGFVYPLTEGIRYLKKADSLFTGEDAVLADIDYKLGDLLLWQGLGIKAAPWYEKSISIQPFNANARNKLVDIYDASGQFTAAMVHLDSLLNRKEINLDKQLLLADYQMRQSAYEFSSQLLKDARQVYPYPRQDMIGLTGKLKWLSNEPAKAIEWYQQLLRMQPDDKNTLYSLARCYAATGKATEAWTCLSKAISNGFGYTWVLKIDDAWKSYRTKQRWTELMSAVRPVRYPPPANSSR